MILIHFIKKQSFYYLFKLNIRKVTNNIKKYLAALLLLIKQILRDLYHLLQNFIKLYFYNLIYVNFKNKYNFFVFVKNLLIRNIIKNKTVTPNVLKRYATVYLYNN